jgi:UDP-N-acetylglucosamine--N-acetylmuramyl-(pentapeptide) pyrophosphoryl-undecaprenol N-acetylglucosamine transferase
LDLNFLADAYALADVVVTRAGVSNLSECAALGKPTIVIPIVDSPADHQKQNALEIKRFGAIVLEEANLIEHIFINQIRHLIDPSIAESVRNSITQFVEPDAAVKIAELILDYD